jgi:predicted nucleic-acid-binding protein
VKAFDTNILARYIVGDDPAQARLAVEALAEPGFVSDTVLLETAWLLASRYRIGRSELVAQLRDLLSLPQLSFSDPAAISWAVERFAAGADLADMLHLVGARGTDAFATFDRGVAVAAGAGSPVPVETLG